MSRVYFTTPTDEAKLLGAERAHLGWLVGHQVPESYLRTRDFVACLKSRGIVNPRHHAANDLGERFITSVLVNLFDTEPPLVWNGHQLNPRTLSLNTALVLGGDSMMLAARIDAQCEIHGWVDGPNRAWLADMVDTALEDGVFRRTLKGSNLGWDGIVKLLRSRDDEPVVMSYSVTNLFPDPNEVGWQEPWPEGVTPGDEDALTEEQLYTRGECAAWYALSDEEQWDIGMRYLRSQPGGLELRPDTWNGCHFGDGLSWLDLAADDWKGRLSKALPSH